MSIDAAGDDYPQLPGEFQRAKQRFEQAMELFAAGRCDDVTLTHMLQATNVSTEDGATWALGAATRLWYRRAAGETGWTLASPPLADPRAGW